MTTLLIVSTTILILLVLIQNPKGVNKNLTATVGAKTSQTFITKSTWIFGIGIAILTLGLA